MSAKRESEREAKRATRRETNHYMSIDGLTVHLDLAQTFGRTPDTFVVTVPDGFFADPPVLVLDEEARGVIRIAPWLGF